MPKSQPRIIVRPRTVLQRYIPVGHTVLGELMAQGLLEVVPLTPKGRAKGITLESIIRYQREVMGLESLGDQAAEAIPLFE